MNVKLAFHINRHRPQHEGRWPYRHLPCEGVVWSLTQMFFQTLAW